jgi:hypothetical protein
VDVICSLRPIKDVLEGVLILLLVVIKAHTAFAILIMDSEII